MCLCWWPDVTVTNSAHLCYVHTQQTGGADPFHSKPRKDHVTNIMLVMEGEERLILTAVQLQGNIIACSGRVEPWFHRVVSLMAHRSVLLMGSV